MNQNDQKRLDKVLKLYTSGGDGAEIIAINNFDFLLRLLSQSESEKKEANELLLQTYPRATKVLYNQCKEYLKSQNLLP